MTTTIRHSSKTEEVFMRDGDLEKGRTQKVYGKNTLSPEQLQEYFRKQQIEVVIQKGIKKTLEANEKWDKKFNAKPTLWGYLYDAAAATLENAVEIAEYAIDATKNYGNTKELEPYHDLDELIILDEHGNQISLDDDCTDDECEC